MGRPGQRNPVPARHLYVGRSVAFCLLALPLLAADTPLDTLLNSVERHYNGVRTLQVSFHESYTGSGRPKRSESGELFLRKPGKMRWQYTAPVGKLFMSDGKQVYYYNPTTNRAEKVKMKETEDMRAPLAFLLGRLDFQKDFQGFQTKQDSGLTVIAAEPKSDRVPYKHVEFAVTSQFEIRKLTVTGHDNAILSFLFEKERMNPPIEDKMFRFVLPPGATWMETADTEGAAR